MRASLNTNDPSVRVAEKRVPMDFFRRVKWFAIGIAKDFWKDGSENPFRWRRKPVGEIDSLDSPQPGQPLMKASAAHEWHAKPGEISEKMWGEGFLAPGTKIIADLLIKPLALNKEMRILDLSAGLGGRMRKTIKEFDVYITGLEPDPQIAARGMEISAREGMGKHAVISHYDPNNFSVPKKYDCVIIRETLYRVTDKNKFIETIAACTKPKAQISFTDYIVNPEDNQKKAIAAWKAYETGAAPLSQVDMIDTWSRAGFELRVSDDQTDFYRDEVVMGLKRFVSFMQTDIRPDPETRKAIQRRIKTWEHRLASLDQGMKFFRFYGNKK